MLCPLLTIINISVIWMKVKVKVNKSYGEPYAVYENQLKKTNIYPLLSQREKKKIDKTYEVELEVIVSKKLYDAITS